MRDEECVTTKTRSFFLDGSPGQCGDSPCEKGSLDVPRVEFTVKDSNRRNRVG